MLTPNGGVFGRNPKFNNVTVDGNLTVNGDIALGDDITIVDTLTVGGATTLNGGMTVRPNASAPTSNVTIGPSAGANLVADSTGNICIGSGAGDVLGASGRNIAIGTDALGAFSAGAASITTSVAGSGGTPGTYDVTLEKDSGAGGFATYPTVRVTVAAGGTVVANPLVLTPGSGATVASGLVFRAVSYPAGLPTAWRGTLASVTGDNVAIGHNAGLLQTTGSGNTLFGALAGDAITTGGSNVAIGNNALGVGTTGSNNIIVGTNAGSAITTASSNTAVGANALGATTTGSFNDAFGSSSLRFNTTGTENVSIGSESLTSLNGSNNVALGQSAGRFRGSGTSTLTSATGSIFIGRQSRAADNSQSNQIVIGASAIGDGSNTTVVNNSDTESTRIAGTATSVLRVSGNTVRIDNARTPATAGAAGNAGDICWDADYIYVCVAANTWKRTAIATWP